VIEEKSVFDRKLGWWQNRRALGQYVCLMVSLSQVYACVS